MYIAPSIFTVVVWADNLFQCHTAGLQLSSRTLLLYSITVHRACLTASILVCILKS